ncbi:MAG: copper homeostasis protein CutC [Candidatus Marinimicrobia bacterium]|nr:copper homeostasis protein CutC [Candidatus Neomarinimicrobiota bacterium]|tara:strand:- start:101 stop:754 length:654 start_codon:yes stop_codon:yes gene_type:complete
MHIFDPILKKRKIPIKEVCIETTAEAVNAERRGAERLELCKNLELDGLTPDISVIQKTIKSVNIPVKVMIRPRPGNFIYNQDEIEMMERDIDLCKSSNVPEVVVGVLRDSGIIDSKLTNRLASRAYPMAVTFHKAIDQTIDILNELDRLSRIEEISSILTSGGENTALDGQAMLRKIINRYDRRFNVIVAGSITDKNFNKIHELINAQEYHGKNLIA